MDEGTVVVPVGKEDIAVGTLTSGLPVGVMMMVVVRDGVVGVDWGGGEEDGCEKVNVVVVSVGTKFVGTVGWFEASPVGVPVGTFLESVINCGAEVGIVTREEPGVVVGTFLGSVINCGEDVGIVS